MNMESLDERGDADDANRVGKGGRSGPALPDWLGIPPDWPEFMGLSRNQVLAIRVAEQAGVGRDGRPFDRARVNEGLAQLSAEMRERAAQVDAWLAETHARIAGQERFAAGASVQDWKRVHRQEIGGHARHLIEKAKAAIWTSPSEDDPYHGIRWAVLLDPRRRQGDPALSNVALWSRDILLTHDGGLLQVRDDLIWVPGRGGPRTATAQAGEQAVLEAAERGWDEIEIVGNAAFAAAARKKAVEMGLSAKVTILEGSRRTADRFEAFPPEFESGLDGMPVRQAAERQVTEPSEDLASLDLADRTAIRLPFRDGYARLQEEQAALGTGSGSGSSLAAAFGSLPEGRSHDPDPESTVDDDMFGDAVTSDEQGGTLEDGPDPLFA